MTERIKQLADQLAEIGADAFLVTDDINVGYLSGFSGDSSYLLVTPSGTTILSDGRYETQIADECPDLTAVIRYSGTKMTESLKSVLSDLGLKNVAVESSHLSLTQYRTMSQEIDSVQWTETNGVVEALRAIKDADEIQIIRDSIRINQQVFQSVVGKLRPNWTEREIAHEFEATMRFLGAEGVSFVPIIGGDAAGALPHYRPGKVTLDNAQTLLIDWGTFYGGYASDMTRTLHRGQPSDKFRSAYNAVLDSQLAAIEAIAPGVPCKDVDKAARDVLTKAGLAEYFVHGLGHGIGLQIHEAPRMSPATGEVLQTGMVITVEPGVYFEGEFGIRIEDDVLVTEDGYEVLSSTPKGLDESQFLL